MKQLMTGNEAIARGFYEAGGHVAAAYPGTPSTEILENMAQYKEIYSEWGPNEKVALEVAIGASIAGARSLAAMKHVGVNVAADPLFTFAYTGVNGPLVLVSADDPGMHSSQNEQDNRYFAKFAKIAMIEPSSSQEAKDFIAEALRISEEYDVPVLYRVTTRICHSKSMVELGERKEEAVKPYVKNVPKFVATPANAKKLHVSLEEKLKRLEEYSNDSILNVEEMNEGSKIGIVTSGVTYQYVKEVFGSEASFLKLGFTFPLPMKKIQAFAEKFDTVYVVEELEPYIEEQMKAHGIKCIGKEKISNIGELNPDIIANALLGKEIKISEGILDTQAIAINRPPTMCAGCPHRGLFYTLSKEKNIVISGDIGCYTLGVAPPLSAMDTVICMGASISSGHGMQKVFDIFGNEENKGSGKNVVSVIGDSTFFHSGMTGLVDVIYNNSSLVTVIVDNRITGMTGHQENPGTGYTLMGDKTNIVDIEAIVRAIGVKHVEVVNPLDLEMTKNRIKEALKLDEPSVIITKWPCVLKKFTEEDKAEYACETTVKYRVNEDLCKSCRLCLKSGCPALSFDKYSHINEDMCVGCAVCAQICPFDAIEKAGE